MAFLANGCSVFPNRTLTSLLTFSFSNLPKHHHRPYQNHPYPCPRMTISASSSVANTSSDVQPQHSNKPTPSTCKSKTWSEFAKNVSGEWDGYGADFTNEGKPTELPEYVVPEAYREWEVKVFDWQTQCPTLAQPEDHLLLTKLIKLLPTVGCEADAATRYTVEERNVGGADSKVSAFAYHSGGSYVAVWPMEEEVNYNGTVKDELLELEHCLVDPRNRESRVRVIQVVVVDGSKLVLRSIKVFCEQYYGPFRNGDQLGGCAIRDSAFASTAALKGSQVTGVWQARNSIARFQTPPHTKLIEELVDDSVQNFARDEGDLILLPKQLWCSLKETENGETCTEVGWLFDQGRAVTSRCIFSSDSKLKEIALACETAALEGL